MFNVYNEDHSDRRIQIDLASKVIGASYNDIVLPSILCVKRKWCGILF